METREKLVPVRLSEEEVKILKERAKKSGLKLSTYLRVAALEKI